MTAAAILLLGADRFEALVRRTIELQPDLCMELSPFDLAALKAANEQMWEPRFGWSPAARNVVVSLIISAAVEAEARSRFVAA